jgi:hypothetical protein
LPLSLGLIQGGWNVTAANNIVLQEVNNPNGDFNTKSGTVNHQFNYASADYVNLTAANGVELGGNSETLPRLDSIDSLQVPVIFPGILDIMAGAGGVTLTGDSTYNELVLFPSPTGSLKITTTDGGSLTGPAGSIFDLVVSDSGADQYNDAAAAAESLTTRTELFGPNDHAQTPVHLNSETPLILDISGDMDNVLLSAPEAAQVTVVGNLNDSRFRGMNLSANDTTSIDVTGDINNPLGGGSGYLIGGGGQFDITADNIDLGTTSGIQSWGIGFYNLSGDYPLASLFNTGANIQVDVSGNLSMISSAVASFNGGNISINAGGEVVAGSTTGVTALGARGIYTTDQGDVTVIAGGDIDVNGSRIATYDGGNVTVESRNGNINAGTGGGGFVTLTSFSMDPKTHKVVSASPTIPGSGILATTFPDSIEWQEGDTFVTLAANPVVGNILVETPNGNIVASAGGIIQSPLNSAKGNANAVTEVLAGYELRDSNGHPVTAADIAAGTPVMVSDNENVDASGSGIIGENVVGKATGTFKGAVFGTGNVNLTAPQFSGLTVLGQTIEAQGNLGAGDTLIGAESVTTSGGSGGATILSQNANGGGSSFAQGTVANSTSAAASSTDATEAAEAAKTDTSSEDDPLKKKKSITLARKVSRVTVLLPGQH